MNTDETHAAQFGARNQNPQGLGFWALVREDFRTYNGDLFAQGFWAVLCHRFGNWRMTIRPKLLRAPFSFVYMVWSKKVQIFAGISIPYTVKLGRRVKLEHFGGMILVAKAIGDDVTIRQNTTFGLANLEDRHSRPTIGNGVDIGAGAVIVGNIHIGDHAVIGANAVVLADVPPCGVAVGVPARVVKLRPAPA